MIKIIDECCGCAVPGYPCRGSACPNLKAEVHCCDECEEELGNWYYSTGDDEELCEDCFLEKYRKHR